MKSSKLFTGKVVAFVITLLMVVSTTSLFAKDSTAKVIRLQGAARYTTGNNVWLPLHAGDVLKAGALIQTAEKSWVDLALGSYDEVAPSPVVRKFTYSPGADTQQTVVRLRENTLMAIDKLTREQTGADVVTDTELDLRHGQMLGNVKKMSAASRFEIKLKDGVAGVRGTVFSISFDGILTVFIGSVVISYLDPNDPNHEKVITKTVVAGEQFDLNTGSVRYIPGSDRDSALQEAAQASATGPLTTTPIVFFTDQTIGFISPVIGDERTPEDFEHDDHVYTPPIEGRKG